MLSKEEFSGRARACLTALATDMAARSAFDTRYCSFATALREVKTDRIQRGPYPKLEHPTLSLLDGALGAMPRSPLAVSAGAAAQVLDWIPVFEGGGIDPILAEGMLAAQIAGSYGCFASTEMAAGLFLLAPGVHYPLHTHAAAEVYACLSGTLWITHGLDAAPFPLRPGEVSLTPPHRLHALETRAEPALLAYIWTGEVICTNWWWSQGQDGAWQRTAWRREPGEPWRPVRSEAVSPAAMAEAMPEREEVP
ncbi:MAG: dimethylsulfonioproprionate lyase family protein [Pseudomonadota bacterium]